MLNWTDYFLTIALVVSLRSKDQSTKHGCVITTKSHRIISTGYNSFPRLMPDDQLPQTRPEKYKHFIHSEENAVLNLNSPINPKEGAIAYVTGYPCYNCLCRLWNAGVDEVHFIDRRGWSKDGEEKEDIDFLVDNTALTLESHKYSIVSVVVMLFNLFFDRKTKNV